MTGDLSKIDSYPPRNVIQIDENNWEVQFAVAGFKRENLSVAVENSEVIIKGQLVNETLGQFLFKGIGVREFEHKITVPDNAIISPSLEDGLLRIHITKPHTEPSQKVLEIL
jgi:HSP20 family molecular chaperone IbpA